jgi:hypothetical protein
MNGQWIGTFSGTSTGMLVLDLDDVGSNYAGVLFAYESNNSNPRTFFIELPKQQGRFTQRVELRAVERGTGRQLTRDELARRDVPAREHANTEWEITPKQISLRWKTDIGASLDGRMDKSEAASRSVMTASASVSSWEDFKKLRACSARLESGGFPKCLSENILNPLNLL